MRCPKCGLKFSVLNPDTDSWAVLGYNGGGGWIVAADKPLCMCGTVLVCEVDKAVWVGGKWINVGKIDPVFTDEAIKN